MKSGILGFRIQYKAQGIGDPANDQLESGIQIPLTEIRNPWRGIQNPILYCLGFSYVGRHKEEIQRCGPFEWNTSSRFCLKVLKLMIWTGSIYFKANLTFSFACLSKNNLRFRRSNFEQTFSLNESYFVLFYITCLIHELGLRASSTILGESREVTRERTRVRGVSLLSRAFSEALSYLLHFCVKQVSVSNELD